MPNHMQKIKPKFIFDKWLILVFNHFGHAWQQLLEMTDKTCNFYESLATC